VNRRLFLFLASRNRAASEGDGCKLFISDQIHVDGRYSGLELLRQQRRRHEQVTQECLCPNPLSATDSITLLGVVTEDLHQTDFII
jgi:hypothetical protein